MLPVGKTVARVEENAGCPESVPRWPVLETLSQEDHGFCESEQQDIQPSNQIAQRWLQAADTLRFVPLPAQHRRGTKPGKCPHPQVRQLDCAQGSLGLNKR